MPVDQTLVEQFQRDGFAHVRGLLTKEEAAMYRAECHALAERLSARHSIDATWASSKEAAMGQATQLLHCHDVQFYSAPFSRLIVDPRMTDYAAAFIGSENVELHHTKMFIKPPEKGSAFPMHQDKPFFPFAKDTMIAVIFHFDDAPLEKGCLRVMPGTHRSDLEHDPEGAWHLPHDQYPVDQALPIPAEAGDAIFFSYRTVHGSGLNTSDEARTTLLVQMRDPSDWPTLKTHESRGQGMIL
ncbi:MAG: phytanoyl-CoA dioxygenase family protein, partial [Fimbriimonadaceae bacterium]|nr:phytanoyl-CoA dioxygenase family protein [Fimbriimonadaceae bacterium]